jgi:vesicle-fusing ATPase
MAARPQNPPGGGYAGGGYAKESYGGGAAGYPGGYGDARSSYQQPQSRQVRLRLAKVEDKTLQSQYIFGDM